MRDTEAGNLTEAAIAIPILQSEGDEPQMLLTRRPITMFHHPGELCFPGGKRDLEDSSLYATALRELYEELGVSPDSVLGYRGEVGCATTSGFYIEPFVVVLAADVEIRPNVREVADYCAIPLSALLDLSGYRIEKFSHSRDDFSFALQTDAGVVRGATCSILLSVVKSVFRAGGLAVYLAEIIANH